MPDPSGSAVELILPTDELRSSALTEYYAKQHGLVEAAIKFEDDHSVDYFDEGAEVDDGTRDEGDEASDEEDDDDELFDDE